MTRTTKPHAFIANAVLVLVIAVLAGDIARSGYHFGRYLAGL